MKATIWLAALVLMTTIDKPVTVRCDRVESSTTRGDTLITGPKYRISIDDGQQQSSTSMALYKEPSSLIVNVLKELFDDIDWRAIDDARVQIEKFIHKVERIIGSFRSILTKTTSGYDGSAARESRSFASRWWSANKSAPDATPGADTTSVKEMLERVACFVGYVRLMNLNNEALAELDASKVVTNLFSSVKRNSSAWSWFG